MKKKKKIWERKCKINSCIHMAYFNGIFCRSFAMALKLNQKKTEIACDLKKNSLK